MEPFDEDYSFGYAPILVSVGGASLISLISRDEKEEGGLVATLFRAFHQQGLPANSVVGAVPATEEKEIFSREL